MNCHLNGSAEFSFLIRGGILSVIIIRSGMPSFSIIRSGILSGEILSDLGAGSDRIFEATIISVESDWGGIMSGWDTVGWDTVTEPLFFWPYVNKIRCVAL